MIPNTLLGEALSPIYMMDGSFKMILKDHDNNAVAPQQQRVHRVG
jgi:hypothetical protein